jgi:hypothetical protein
MCFHMDMVFSSFTLVGAIGVNKACDAWLCTIMNRLKLFVVRIDNSGFATCLCPWLVGGEFKLLPS